MGSVLKNMEKETKKKVIIGVSCGAGLLLMVYIGFTIFFAKHFYYRTFINGEKVGGKTVSEVEKLLKEKSGEYSLVLKERGNKEETILGSDIQFTYKIESEVSDIKKEQNPFTWIFKVWGEKDVDVPMKPVFDEALLKKDVNALECLLPANSKAPVDASIAFENNSYQIVEEDEGSLIKKDELFNAVEKAAAHEEGEINLEDLKCYEVPKYTSESKELIEKRDKLNQYVESKITYDFGDRTEVLDGSIIKDWIKEDENHQLNLDEETVKVYVKELAKKYDTLYGTRQFKTSVGTTVTVSGGDYGWRINQEEESKELMELLKSGKQEVTRKPVYELEARCRETDDVGNTYVEINLTRQYLWFYKEGKLVTEGSIVSGTATRSDRTTPEGTYRIDYVEANATLRGPGYATPVSFWMPFNCGIGIHDAVWRGSFGGDIYIYNGSHGCINAPYTLAQTIFNNIEAGVAVICYKD